MTARHLASIKNQQEQDFIVNLTGGRKSWIGGVKLPDGSWAWTDGRKWGSFINWALNTPGGVNQPDNYKGNQNALKINFARAGSGLWDDDNYLVKEPYVCQYLNLTQV